MEASATTHWVMLDGCASLHEVVHRLAAIRCDYIALYRAGAIVTQSFHRGNGMIRIRQKVPKEALDELMRKEFPLVDLTSRSATVPKPGTNDGDELTNQADETEDEPTFKIMRPNRILNGCCNMEDVINALARAIECYMELQALGWELGDAISENIGFLFPNFLMIMQQNSNLEIDVEEDVIDNYRG